MENKTRNNIVWVASYPKSGNTWIRFILSQLYAENEVPIELNEIDSASIASSRTIFDEVSGVASSDLTDDEIDNLRSRVYNQLNEESDGFVVKKVHDAWSLSSNGGEIFEAKYTRLVIYLVRNPLDVAVSYAYHSARDLNEIIDIMNDDSYALCQSGVKLHNQLRQSIGDWSGHILSWVDHSKLPVIVVRYEDLLKNPLIEINRILGALGDSFPIQRVENAINHSSFQRLSDMEKAGGFKEKPMKMEYFFRSGKSGEGEQVLTQEQKTRLINKHAGVIKRFGYA